MLKYSVAIDGPSGAGKSAVSKAAASSLGIVHVDTGAIYRTIGLYFYNKGISCDDEASIVPRLPEIDLKVVITDEGQKMLLSGVDVSQEIRQHHISKCASQVSAIPKVREYLLGLQRDFAKKQSVVMDGRDIATVVLPDADVKIFLTASPEQRAKRRFDELAAKGQSVDYNSILKDVIDRDYADSHRAVAPLKPASDSITVDTTDMTLEEAVHTVIELIKERIQCF